MGCMFLEKLLLEKRKHHQLKRNLIDNNKVFTIVDNKLVSKEIEVVQILKKMQ